MSCRGQTAAKEGQYEARAAFENFHGLFGLNIDLNTCSVAAFEYEGNFAGSRLTARGEGCLNGI